MSSPNDLAKEIAKAMSEYSAEIEDKIDGIAKDVVNEAVTELKATSPKRYGKYARNWRSKKNAKASYVVYNAAPTYRLTHLLEKSHILRNGGRSRSFKHIKPVEEKVNEQFEKRIKELGR